MKAFLVACELLTLWPLARDPAAARLAARAAADPRLEPARARRDRGQRAQRGVRIPVPRAGRWPRSRPAAPSLRRWPRPSASRPSSCPGWWPRPGRGATGSGTSSWRRRWPQRVVVPYYAGAAQDVLAEPLEATRSSGASTRRCSRRSPRSRAAIRSRFAWGRALALVLALGLAWRRTEPVAAAIAVVAASLLLGPNVLPWYALWFLPLLVVRDEPAALLFTGTAALAYLVYPAWQSGEVVVPRLGRAGARVRTARGGPGPDVFAAPDGARRVESAA